MVRPVVIKLVNESPTAHGVFDAKTETGREVYADIRSVGYNEFYAAKNAGIEPTIIFRLSDYSEYQGEKLILFDSKRYRVVRTYCQGMTIDITAEEATNDRS